MKDKTTVAAALVDILQVVGIDTGFGVPGGQTLPFYSAAISRGFRHVMMHDERNAACAADAYARVSGRVGVCDATVGPGVTNLVSGLAEALASSVPVIALIADIVTDIEHLRRGSIGSQAFEQKALMENVSKWVGRIQKPEQVADIMAHALRVATTGRPGPVVVEIPEEIWQATVPSLDLSRFTAVDACWPRHRTTAPMPVIERAMDCLLSAQRPVILAGGGAVSSGAFAEVTALVEEFTIPIVTSLNGKGIVDEHHPLAHGAVGVLGSVRASDVLRQADVVLTLGSKYAQFNSFSWQLPHKAQRIIQVDVNGEELNRAISAEVEIVADIKEAAQQLLTGLRASERSSFAWQPSASPKQPCTKEDDPDVPPEAVVKALNERLTEQSVLVCDASSSSGWGAAGYKVRGVGRKFIVPRGLAGIGWSCGAAIGAALAAPEGTQIAVLTGDGSAAYWLGEIETAVRLKLPITFVILNNSSFAGMIGLDESLGFAPVDFAMVGRGLGAGGGHIHSVEEISEGINTALDHKGPYVLNVLSSVIPNAFVPYDCIDSDKEAADGAYGV